MDEGEIIQVATPADIYERPNSVYVADFIGDVNILNGHATRAGDGYDIAYAEGKAPLHAKTTSDLGESSKCALAIRPEKVSITAAKPAKVTNAIKGKIIDIAYLGNLSTYHVEIEGGHMIKAQTANTTRLERRSFTWEDTVWLSWTDTAAIVLEG
jgi:putrescine transport system ATP-binding protein